MDVFLCRTRSVLACIPTQSVGTRKRFILDAYSILHNIIMVFIANFVHFHKTIAYTVSSRTISLLLPPTMTTSHLNPFNFFPFIILQPYFFTTTCDFH
ncbi:membrane protein [Candidatus Thiomargarita nelsonii]|uniref:Membrane protein n=1 Tax=Candidatus Thiomargarita nelsonii TaxID=1003181 RepID=A0A176S6A5_9GAMM|nr:membrane protein [Candidatus Thiomargarita nelsonii]